MSKSKKAAKSVAIIILFSFGSKILGFIRELLLAAKYGSGMETDTFFIALSATTLFTTMITQSINTTMIPVLSEIEAREGKQGKIEHTNNLLNIIILISFILMFFAWMLAPAIIRLLASGFKGKQFQLAVLMTRIGIPSILFASIQGVFRGYLQSEMMFTESAAAAFPFNFVYIFFLLFLTNKFDMRGLMVVSVIAVASQITIQLPSIKKTGFRYTFIVDFKDKYVKNMVHLIPPVLIGATINDLNNIVDKSMASNLMDGSISALQYSSKLNSLVQSTFISAITTVIYPMLSQDVHKKDYKGLKKTVVNGLNIIMLITIPATIGMIILSTPIVKVAFERDAFDPTATFMTAGALVFYALSLASASMKGMTYRVYYSLQDTRTPMMNSLIALIINIVLNLLLIKHMGHKGLALATSIASIVTLLYLLYKLKQKIGPFGFSKSVKCGVKSLAASAIMGLVVYFLYDFLSNLLGSSNIQELISLLTSAGIGAIIYFILIYIFRIEEVNWAIGLVRGRLNRKK